MKELMLRASARINTELTKVAMFCKRNQKAITAAYVFSIIFSCLSMGLAFAGDDLDLWRSVDAIIGIVLTAVVVIGIFMVIIGLVLLFINRMSEQSITGPLVVLVIGIVLVVLRIVLGETILKIAFEQVYDGKYTWDDWKKMK